MRNTETMLITPRSKRDNDFNFRIDAIGRTTEWHEGHQKFEVWRKNNANDKQISQELEQAN